MSITFYRTPCLLLEAVEILFVYANRLPAQVLTRDDSPYCIPAMEIEKMIRESCSAIPLEDETLHFFFQRYALPQTPEESYTCLARLLTFSFLDLSCSDLDSAIQSIQRDFQRLIQEHFTFESLDAFTIGLRPHDSGQELPFANGLGQLAAPDELKDGLFQILSNPASRLASLAELMRPVIDYLGPALETWVAQAEPMAELWEQHIRERSLNQLVSECLYCNLDWPISSAKVTLLYFVPGQLTIGFTRGKPNLQMLIGVACKLPGHTDPSKFASWEYPALRLLGSPARIKMLSAMCERPMSSREIAKSLNLHRGTVARDINSMQEVHLLNVEYRNGHCFYSVNYPTLCAIAEHLLTLRPKEFPACPPAENQ